MILLLLACGGPPEAPADNDPAYAITQREWSLVGNDLTPGHDRVEVSVEGASGRVRVWLDGQATALDGGAGTLDVSDLPVGEHELVWQDGAYAFAATRLVRTHPLYVVPSVDWDSADTADKVLEWQDELHAAHPSLRITHLVGPYTWTDPALSDARKQALTDWLVRYRDHHGDEIGLHIHPYCHFVEAAGVSCRTTPSFVYDEDETGYTVPNFAYTEEQFATLVAASREIFAAQGLDAPTSYRAGGWTATVEVLRALHSEGILVDGSANNWSRMEEWEGTGTLYSWNAEHWATIDETSQPYHPDRHDALAPGDDPIGLLEVPDNAILADYVDDAEMIEILHANWGGGALPEPRQLSMGWHDSASAFIRRDVEETFDEIDRHLAVDDGGPLVYATMTELVDVW